MNSPKMRPTGAKHPLVYLLGTGPNAEDDRAGQQFEGKAGREILSKFSRSFVDQIRFNHLTQCMPPVIDGERDLKVDVVELECCRPRIVQDIEKSKPLVVIGIGDQPLAWATGITSGTPTFRGQLIATKIGSHVCWYLPVMWPNYLFKKRGYQRSEYQLAIEHDLRWIEQMLADECLPQLDYHDAPYDRGIELIDGTKPGDMQRLERALADMAGLPDTALDIETNGLRPYIENPLLLSAAVGTFDRTIAFCIDMPDGWGSTAQRRRVHGMFAEFLLFSNKKFCHNLGFEQEWFSAFYGPTLLRRTEWGDTMAMAHTLDERAGTKALDIQTRIHFGFNLKDQSPVDVRKPKWWELYSMADRLRYNGLDTKWTHRLAHRLPQMIKAEGSEQWREYERKVRLSPTLVLTQSKGLPADQGYAQQLDATMGAQIDKIKASLSRCAEVKAYSQRFGVFDPGNSHHVLKLLQTICKRDEVRKEDRDGSVSFSSDEEVLSSLPRTEVPSAPLILEYRGLEKVRGTYLDPVIKKKVIAWDGLIHCSYSSMIAETGRLAAFDPNIQNWPKRKHREVRGIVYALDGQWMVACDYGQIEFRVVGMASEDPNLVKHCWTGYDVHGFWAERFVKRYPRIKDWIVDEFEIDWDEKGHKTLRQEAKNKWVFPLLFGSSLNSCAGNLHLPEDVAEELGAEFWDEFPDVQRWQERLMKSYERDLFVTTLTGRKRRGPMTKNQIINHPIQGTAADIVLEGMSALSERADLEDDQELQPSLNVHDDLSTFLADKTMERKTQIIVEEMIRPRFDWINVPLVVEVSVGPRWDQLQEIAKYRSDVMFNQRNPYK